MNPSAATQRAWKELASISSIEDLRALHRREAERRRLRGVSK